MKCLFTVSYRVSFPLTSTLLYFTSTLTQNLLDKTNENPFRIKMQGKSRYGAHNMQRVKIVHARCKYLLYLCFGVIISEKRSNIIIQSKINKGLSKSAILIDKTNFAILVLP